MIWHEIGQEYEGEWSHGRQHGKGTGTWHGQKKTTYTGDWQYGKRSGIGKIEYANGSSYEGHWLNDKKSGQAHLTNITGDKVSAYFENDRLVSHLEGFNTIYSITESEVTVALGKTLEKGKGPDIKEIIFRNILCLFRF